MNSSVLGKKGAVSQGQLHRCVCLLLESLLHPFVCLIVYKVTAPVVRVRSIDVMAYCETVLHRLDLLLMHFGP